jgi:hypothetical protein
MLFFNDVSDILLFNNTSPINNLMLITGKNSRNVIKHYLTREELILLLLEEFATQKKIIIIGNLTMCIELKYPSLPKPQLIKIPKPTSDIVRAFYKHLKKSEFLKNGDKNIYYKLYNNALKEIGSRYITRYEKIKTFYDGKLDTYYFLSLSRGDICNILSKDILKYISEYVPYIYIEHKVHHISQKCKKCYNQYHMGIATNYHQVIGSTLCGLCNEDRKDHLLAAQICPKKYKNDICKCHYVAFCVCKTFNMAFSHDIFQTRHPIVIKGDTIF